MYATSTAILLALLLPPQDGGRSLAQQDATAARAITQEFGLSRWSDKLLERSLSRAKSSDDRAELLLARCDILRLKAFRTVDEKERLGILGEAGVAYAEFLESSGNSRNVSTAQQNLGQLTELYGRTLSNLLEAGQLSEEEKTTYIATAEEIFKSGLKVLNGLLDTSEAGTLAFNQATFSRAMVYRYWAGYYPADSLERDQYANRALGYLEEFAISANLLPSMLAYNATADVYRVLQDWESSNDFYDYVIFNTIDALATEEVKDYPELAQALEGVVQQSYAGWLAMLRESGNQAGFDQIYGQFLDWLDKERIELTSDGYLAQLEVASQLVDNGESAQALALAKEVADNNPQSFLRLKANAVMGNAIKNAPDDVVIEISTLFDAAEGAFFEKRYEDSVENFRRILPRLSRNPDASEYGGRAYYLLARSWSNLGYDLFAALAHEQGAKDYPDDEDSAAKNAVQWEKITARFLSANASDRAIEDWHTEAVDMLAALDIGGGDVQMNEAKRLNNLAKSYYNKRPKPTADSKEGQDAARAIRKAIDAYEAIDANSDSYEKALVQRGSLYFELGSFEPGAYDTALGIYNDYLNNYITAEENTPSDPRSRKVRADSEPLAAFNVGRIYRAKAKAGDTNSWPLVLSSFENLRERYPTQQSLADDAMRYRIEAFLNLGKVEDAEAEYQAMLAVPASDVRISIGAFYLYSAWAKTVDQAEDLEARLAAKERELQYLHAYNSFASNPRWQNLLGEANLQMEMDHPEVASGLYQRILNDFEKASDMTDISRFSARIGFVESLLAMRRVGEAVPVVEALVQQKPKNLRVKIAVVKVKAGFLAWDGRNVLEVPGEGTLEALELAKQMASDLVQLGKYEAEQEGKNPFYYAPWWEAKLSQAYVYYQLGKTDPAEAGKHKRMIESLQKQDPTLGEGVAGKRISESFKWLLLR